ncbi:cytochrome c-type biogenesis protein [Caldimonas brevitalea]|uniref:Cytochrome c-type biogenesis protein n=1 Tax=Caldimonas brevitalea TaxID=413882 RepID=A0A0G3BG94_9BURK|nr:cytochrome c-type biogenesis protein [Caldimonas brevitalea]AKJ28322.1 cytochrome c-type biogenesis protein CcmH [Caldimonas brevitalea]
MKAFLLSLTSLLCMSWALAAAPDEARLQALAAELRCPVCQNQSLADSNAELAADLRQEIRRQLEAGHSDQEVRDYMVSRYGEFVLYEPRLGGHTLLLWIGPFAMLGAAVAVLAWRVRRRASAGTTVEDAAVAPESRP